MIRPVWFVTLFVVLPCWTALAQHVSANSSDSFPIVSTQGAVADVLVSPGDAPVVRLMAMAFASDVKAVSGKYPRVVDKIPDPVPSLVIAGTLGRGGIVDRLRAEKRIDVTAIDGKWETFAVRLVDHPLPGVERGLIVIGSDPRGTAYGILELSRKMGVSPWIWWADVPPPHRQSVTLVHPEMTSQPPSVQYRGIFINDEDFGFRPWAASTQDTDLNNIGPKTYARVFELLLRLRANTLWPAMHPGTRTFNASPDNARLAAEYAIVMGSSHAEPMLRNNVAEWDVKQRGEWDYEHNRSSVLSYWDERLATNAAYENIYTMGMRGIHDSAMPGSGTDAEKAKLVEKIVADQRDLLQKRVNPSLEKVPQVLWMYKEVLDLYRAGMVIPQDITLGWTDDNYGYIRQLSDSKERERSGGSGVYYHLSYWGAPHDYLWLCTTPPELIKEEMTKAYDYGARKMWIVNVGDIKPAELDIDYFMQIAWDEPAAAALTPSAFLERWAAEQFPKALSSQIADLLEQYYQLNFTRRPEAMGFNQGNGAVRRTGFNPFAFGDQNLARRDEFKKLQLKEATIERELPAAYRDAFFELVSYPIDGAALMNAKTLLTDEAALFNAQGRASASSTQAEAAEAYESLQRETAKWNEIQDGKWKSIMSAYPHGMAVFAPVKPLPANAAQIAEVGVAIEGRAEPLGAKGDKANLLAAKAGWVNPVTSDAQNIGPEGLPEFNLATPGKARFMDVFNSTGAPQKWTATASQPWIHLDVNAGVLAPSSDQRLEVRIDGRRLQKQEAEGAILVTLPARTYTIPVKVTAAPMPAGSFVSNEGSISIGAAHWTHSQGSWRTYPHLSPTGDAVGVPDTPSMRPADPGQLNAQSAYLEYSFLLTNATQPELEVFTLPTFASNDERKARYAISIDDAKPVVVESSTSTWEENVLRNSSTVELPLPQMAAGQHRLKFWYIDPGVLVQHFVLYTSPGPKTYPFPPETRITDGSF